MSHLRATLLPVLAVLASPVRVAGHTGLVPKTTVPLRALSSLPRFVGVDVPSRIPGQRSRSISALRMRDEEDASELRTLGRNDDKTPAQADERIGNEFSAYSQHVPYQPPTTQSNADLGKAPSKYSALEQYGVVTASLFVICLALLAASAPGLIDSSATILAFPAVVLLANGAGPIVERYLIAQNIKSEPLSEEAKALITTTTTVLALKLVSALF